MLFHLRQLPSGIRNARRVMLGCIVLAALAHTGPALGQTGSIPRGGTLKGVFQDPASLNPILTSGSTAGFYGAQLFAGLIQLDERFQVRPYLAERWEVSADGRVYTFHLVRGAAFHDGKPITSEDVKFSIESAKKYHPFGGSMYRALDVVETPNPYTVVIRLKDPYPAFFTFLTPPSLPILPKHIYDVEDFRKNPANLKPVGSGPFKFVEFRKGSHLILERNENFFRKGRPYLDRLVFEFIPDSSTRVAGLENGTIHVVPFSYMPFAEARRLEKLSHLALSTKGYATYAPILDLLANLRNPFLKNLKVRQAIAHALDRDFIGKDLLFGFGKYATGPIVSLSPFYTAQVRRYEYDLDKANRLLDEAGFPRKADGMRFKLNHETLAIFPDLIVTVAEYVREQLKRIGIEVVMRTSPDFATYASRTGNWEFDLTVDFISNLQDPVVGVERVYLSSNIRKGVPYTNTVGYANPEVDKLFAAAQNEQNLEKRKALYHRVQEVLVEDLAVIWLVEVQFMTVYNKKEFEYGDAADAFGPFNPVNPYDTVYWKGKAGG